jgi:CheY-like chemotaxis protein
MSNASTVLVAESNEDDILIMQNAFRDAGISHQLIVVQDGHTALAYLNGDGKYADRKTFPLPALLLIDLHLRLKNGLQILEWIASQPSVQRAVKVVILSPSENVVANRRAHELGVTRFLLRPFAYADLVAMMIDFRQNLL